MGPVVESFFRAAVYCLHPRVIALSFLPLAITIVGVLGLGYFFWNDVIEALRLQLEAWAWIKLIAGALETIGLGGLRAVMAPALLLFATIPFIVIICLLMVSFFMTPAMIALVAERRFPTLERKKGASLIASVAWALGSTLAACLAMVLSVPLWLLPPLVLVLPPLIWGWLSYRVMSYDCLAEHASADERRQLMQQNRFQLLAIGLLTGYLGALPSALWASGAMFIAMAPVLVPVAVWIYTLVFAFSSLWFAHYSLAMLEKLRKGPVAGPVHPNVPPEAVPSLADQRSRDRP
ncbi:MAG: EI24 domain-containing protein [Betaproteobacteria bacterium]